jgi:two-component system, NtrC family, sensor kinase
MSFYALSGLLNLVTSSVVGIFVFTRDVNDRRYQTYGGFCLSLAVWSFGYLFWHLSHTAEEALLWIKVLMAGAIFIPITNFHHIVSLLDKPPWEKRWIPLGYCFSIGFLYLDLFSSWFIKDVSPKSEFSFWPVPGPSFHIYLMLFFYCVLRFIYLLCREIRTKTGIKRNQFKYLAFALSLGYVGGGTNFLLWYDIQIRPYGNILVSVYVILFSYAVIKFSLLDIDFIIKKSLVYALLLLILIMPCFALVIAAQAMTFGEISYSFSLFTLVIFIVVGFLFPKLRIQAEGALEKVLFKKSYDYHETLLRSSRDMISLMDVDSLAERLVHTISSAMRVNKASLCIADETKGEFRFKANTGSRVGTLKDIALSKDDPFIQQFRRSPSTIVREEIENKQNYASGERDVVNRMIELEAEISFPVMSKGKLVGILNLGRKQDQEIYSHEDIELLSTLTNQAAIAIENARLYQNLKQSQDTLRRADRLSSLGLLTAGLAHEIRNPLVAIRTFTQLLPERYEDAEFREGFQGLALKEVDRICGLITDLLSFARPSKPNVVQEDMNDVIDGIARILDTQAKEKSVELTRDFAPNLPKVWIDREQMKQVFMNLIFNGIQAMNDGGTITISTRISTPAATDQSPSFVQVEVRDTGIGIPEENLEHIFDPFFTNKDEGSGLGLSISHQIVQEHGGYVTVESKVGKGTSFLVNIPTGKPVRPVTERNLHVNEANLSH